MKEKQIKEMAEVLSTHFQSELDLKNDISEMANSLYEAGYRKQSDVAREFADRVLKDITDAINHNTRIMESSRNRIMESSRNLNHTSYHNALIANNACKGIYDVITAIAKEFGVEDIK